MKQRTSIGKHVIVFDGVCKVCHWSVNYVTHYDKKDQFRLIPLQDKAIGRMLKQYNIDSQEQIKKSVIVIQHFQTKREAVLFKSQAIVYILNALKPGIMARCLSVCPLWLLDSGYVLFAKIRYSIFGKYDQCIRPDERLNSKWLKIEEEKHD